MLDAWRQRPPVVASNRNERRTHRTDKNKNKKRNNTNQQKKEKYNLRRVDVDFICTFFFSQVYFCCFLLSAWDLHARARTRHLCSTSPYIASPPCSYTFHSHCLFMSFCLCCLHSENCAIFKRLVLVFSSVWTKPMCVYVWVVVVGGVWVLPSLPPIDAVPLPSLFCGWLSWIRRWRRNVARSM